MILTADKERPPGAGKIEGVAAEFGTPTPIPIRPAATAAALPGIEGWPGKEGTAPMGGGCPACSAALGWPCICCMSKVRG